MLRLNLIGAGQVGTTLAYLLTQQADFKLACVLSRTQESANRACDFIGQGKAITDYKDLTPADCYLMTVSDQHIRACTEKLVATQILCPQNLLLHCSGFMTHEALSAAKSQGALIASMHPIKSFVDPACSVKTFAGTFCALEGDPLACQLLTKWVEKIGGFAFSIKSTEKTIYHAGTVIASNYLVALHEVALRTLEKAGIPKELGQKILAPLMQHTLEQSLTLGTTQALSGPITRGDHQIIEAELNALNQWDADIGLLYQQLAKIALSLAQNKTQDSENLRKIQALLKYF